MTLIVRYLSAVRDHLPRGEQDDIINELSDSLRSTIVLTAITAALEVRRFVRMGRA